MSMLGILGFIQANYGQPNVGDTDANKGQCVGLIEVWTDNLGLPHTWGNAIDLLNDADPNSFDVIYNTPDNFPVPGDIAVFGQPYGALPDGTIAGHTGQVIYADINKMALFENNDPDGSTPHFNEYDYSSCLGWLHPKVQFPTEEQSGGLPPNYDDIIRKATIYDELTSALSLPNTASLADLEAKCSTSSDQSGQASSQNQPVVNPSSPSETLPQRPQNPQTPSNQAITPLHVTYLQEIVGFLKDHFGF